MKDELKNQIVNLLEDDFSNKKEVIERLIGMLDDKNLEKVAKILQAYSENPEIFKEMFGEIKHL